MLKINFKKFNPLSRMGNFELVGIDFSSNNLKLVQVKVSPNKKEVINLSSRNISGLSDEEITKAIISAFSELKAKSPKFINIIPAHLAITKNIEIPSTDATEIKEIISLQAGRHTPYSREEIIVDYIDIGTFKHSYTKVLLVIVSRSVVKKQSEILDKAGIKLERTLFAAEALAWSSSKILKLETQDSPANIVHIDESFTDFSVISKNKLVFVRSIPIGAQHLIAEKEKYQLKFVEELKVSLEAYQSEDIAKPPSTLILTGAIDEIGDLNNILNENLGLPVKAIPYFKNVAISEQALKIISEAKRLSFLDVIATLLASQELKVDLIPEEIKLKKSILEREKDLLKTGVLVLTLFVLIFFTLISKIYFKSAHLSNLNKRYQVLEEEAQKLEKDFTKISLIRNYLLYRGFSLEVLTELYNLVPLELALDDIRFDNQGRFNIKGTAESMSAVYAFVDDMEKSKYFKAVKIKYTTKRKEKAKDVTDFEITCLLEKET